jgi:hypothetical protein
MRLLILRMLRILGGVAALLLVTACAGAQIVEHGISVETQGDLAKVYDVQIDYGLRHISFPGAGRGANLWNAPMPIPDSMTVQWTAREVRKKEIVVLKGKTSLSDQIANWKLVFVEDRLEVFRIDLDPSSKYYFKKPVQVYP